MKRRNFLKTMVGLVAVAAGVTTVKDNDIPNFEKTEWIPKEPEPFTIDFDCATSYDISAITNFKVHDHALTPEEVEKEWKHVVLNFNGDGRLVTVQ